MGPNLNTMLVGLMLVLIIVQIVGLRVVMIVVQPTIFIGLGWYMLTLTGVL